MALLQKGNPCINDDGAWAEDVGVSFRKAFAKLETERFCWMPCYTFQPFKQVEQSGFKTFVEISL